MDLLVDVYAPGGSGLPFCLVFLAVTVAVAVVSSLLVGRRAGALQEVARRRGWSFEPRHVADTSRRAGGWLTIPIGRAPPLEAQYALFDVFNTGNTRRASNTLRGRLDVRTARGTLACQAVAGDFRYTVGSGKNSRTTTMTYVMLRLPVGDTPSLVLRPKGWTDRVAGFFGFGDIGFESSDFDDAFHVSGNDRRFAYDVMHPQAMEFLLRERPPKLEVVAGWLLVVAEQVWTPAELDRWIDFTAGFASRWPRHLLAEPPASR